MADMNDLLSQANSAVHRSSYQATNKDFGVNEQAVANVTAAPVPSTQLQQAQALAAMGAGGGPEPMLDPAEWLVEQSERKNKVLSLKTVTPKQKAKIMDSFKRCRDVAKDQYTSVVEPRVLERRRIYEATPEHYDIVFPKLSETSRFTSKDVKTTIGWLIPSLMEAFTGSDEPISVKGVNIEDDPAAENIQQLVQYQLEKKNDYFQFIHTIIEYALSENFAVAKVWWKREEKRTPMKMMLDLNDGDALLQFMQAAAEGKIEVTSAKPIKEAEDFMKIEYEKIEVKANHPVLEYIPTSELRYTPDAARLQDCKFVAHRKVVRGDYLKRREIDGIYENIDKALEEYPVGDVKPTSLDRANDKDRAQQNKRPYDYDNASKEVELYEAYLRVDYNDDGIYENVIVHAVGDEPIRIVENDFEFAPLFICSAKYDPNAVFAEDSFPDEFEQLQDVKTALMRQVITNVAKNNAPRVFVNERNMDMDALLANEEIIGVQGDPAANVMTPPSLPLSSLTMDVIQYCQTELEAQSGSTRYNQGLDSNALNKMLSLDTPIPMADGSYKMNGDIVEGDVLIGSDGKPTTVLKAHPIQMPEKAYLITFQNGEKIKSGGEHRWAVKVSEPDFSHKSAEFEKLPASRLYDLKERGCHIYIPHSPVVEYEAKDLPIDPYIFGLWLGDGNAHTNRFTTMDKEILEAFENWAKQFYKGRVEPTTQQHSGRAVTYQVKNTPFREMLKDLHCLKDNRQESCKGNVKHIPEIYLRASVKQRLALLQGLMDTDGCISKEGYCTFCNSEPALVETVAELIRTLGGIARVSWTHKAGNKYKFSRPHAHIQFSLPMCPARLPRKAERWHYKPKSFEQLRIESIEEIPVEPMRCLTVSAEDELYCCGNYYTVTSNTATGITAIMGASEKRTKMIARSIAEQFIIPIFKYVILLNQRYLEDEQMIRLTNKSISIRKEDLDIDYDLVINVGHGAGTKEAQIQYLMYVLQSIYPQLTSQGIANAKSWYNLVVKLLEALGLRDVSQYLLDPESQEAKQAAAQAQQMAAQQQAEAMQNSLQLAIAKSSVPRVTINTDTLPPDALREYLREKLGIDTSELAIAEAREMAKND